MIPLFHRLPGNILSIFSGENLWGHLVAILLTVLIVTSGFDWWYFRHFHHSSIAIFLFSAVRLGTLLPVLLPLALLIPGYIARKRQLVNTGWAVGQAALLGWLVTSFYKAFTGRPGPHFRGMGPFTDISHVFRFGFWRGGIFWGWPSSHTAVAFAMAFTLFFLFQKNKWIRFIAPLYALYVGVGVSMSIHWFSDFLAGAIVGYIIGSVVARSFRDRLQNLATHSPGAPH